MMRLVVVALLVPLAVASHSPTGRCDTAGAPAMGIIEISPLGQAGPIVYVDDRNYLLGNGVWLYEETNGVYEPGDPPHSLQRGGASFVVPDDEEICVDDPRAEPDQLVF